VDRGQSFQRDFPTKYSMTPALPKKSKVLTVHTYAWTLYFIECGYREGSGGRVRWARHDHPYGFLARLPQDRGNLRRSRI
jgi:hypothetical protein